MSSDYNPWNNQPEQQGGGAYAADPSAYGQGGYPQNQPSAGYPASQPSAGYAGQQAPYHYEPTGQVPVAAQGAPAGQAQPTFMNTLGDFGLKVFGTPAIAKPLWVLCVALALVTWLGRVVLDVISLVSSGSGPYASGPSSYSIAGLIGQLLTGWISPMVTLLFSRMFIEFFVRKAAKYDAQQLH